MVSLLGVRRKSSTPSASSRRLIWVEMADTVRFSRAAATCRVPLRATISNARSLRRSSSCAFGAIDGDLRESGRGELKGNLTCVPTYSIDVNEFPATLRASATRALRHMSMPVRLPVRQAASERPVNKQLGDDHEDTQAGNHRSVPGL